MQLHIARLCLNCDEVHDQLTCPICSSESFAYISRWVPAPERRTQPRQAPSRETADIYRQLLAPAPHSPATNRWVKRGVVGLGVAAIAGWAWRRTSATTETASDAATSAPADEAASDRPT
jgi:hypothetical protein